MPDPQLKEREAGGASGGARDYRIYVVRNALAEASLIGGVFRDIARETDRLRSRLGKVSYLLTVVSSIGPVLGARGSGVGRWVGSAARTRVAFQ